MPNSELLRKYGFVDSPNIFNCVEIPALYLLDGIDEIENEEEKVELLVENDLLDE